MMGKLKKSVRLDESASYGVKASAAGLLLTGALAVSVIYTAYTGPLFDGLLGRDTMNKTVEVELDERTGTALFDALSVYAEENPESSVLTADESGHVTETDPADLAGVVTDAQGNAIGVLVENNAVEDADGNRIGVLVENNAVEDADGNRIGAVMPDGTFVDGAAGVTGDGVPYYHVVWGDTLCKVSSAVHYSVQELAEYNHISNVNLIYAESDLRIPAGPVGMEAEGQ